MHSYNNVDDITANCEHSNLAPNPNLVTNSTTLLIIRLWFARMSITRNSMHIPSVICSEYLHVNLQQPQRCFYLRKIFFTSIKMAFMHKEYNHNHQQRCAPIYKVPNPLVLFPNNGLIASIVSRYIQLRL